jgi:ribosomal protein S18 acetylase RimI-like enzyme
LYLDKPYRGRGIAQRMLACAEARARELDFATIVLSTAEVQNAAIAFYRKSGYRLVRTETRPHDVDQDGRRRPDPVPLREGALDPRRISEQAEGPLFGVR